jgi:aspartate racemase
MSGLRFEYTATPLVDGERAGCPAPLQPLVGVVGGMGPLASAEFLRGLYSDGSWDREQDGPRVLLYSDPAVVDRTAAIHEGKHDELRRAVETAARRLVGAGAVRVVVACVTAHYVFADLPAEVTERCVSLVDIIDQELNRTTEPHLLLCTRGAISARIFAPDRLGAGSARLIRLDPVDQDALHREIYRLKAGGWPLDGLDFLRRMQARYPARSAVAACTELHLVARAAVEAGLAAEFPMIDPLAIVADRIRNGAL